jgi:diguanylate cyclase (GGDEF)-like protein
METPPERDAQGVADFVAGRQTARLRLFFLAPLTAVIFGIVVLLAVQLHVHEQEEIELKVGRIQAALDKMYKDDLVHDADMLHAVMKVIHSSPALRQALARRDRARLLALTKPLFSDLKDGLGITHLYFTGPDRVNLLRVHQPNRHGDIVNRYTTLETERTGTMAHGVELGPLGTFTLRLVHPWYADGSHRLIGYVEFGMEIDHILQGMQDFLDAQVFVLISKEFLRRDDWEAGMKMLRRAPAWDRFPDAVLGIQAAQALPPAVTVQFTEGLPRPPGAVVLEAVQDRTAYRLALSPLRDAAGRTVGEMAVLIDVTHQVIGARRAIWLGSALALAAAGVLFAFFWWLVGRIGRRIERDEQALHDLSTHDRLTGAWNRRWFDEMLAREMKRARRYGLPLSLVMFDIDRFKKVNDTRGHQAGDDLLAALSVYVSAHIRDSDSLARWGGEEFMLVAPNTDIEAARRLAENLRTLIERGDFGDAGRITCSFGVAQLQAGDTPENLTGRADAAMYRAKQEGRNRVCCDAKPGPFWQRRVAGWPQAATECAATPNRDL